METLKRNIQKGLLFFIPFIFLLSWGLAVPDISDADCTPITWGSGWTPADKDKSWGSEGASIGWDGTLTLSGYGRGVWGSEDEYYAYYREDVAGDWDVQVYVESQTSSGWPPSSPDGWAKSGIMVKNDISVSAEDTVSDSTRKYGYCIVTVTPSHGVYFQWDDDSALNGYLDSYASATSVTCPVYLRLSKSGTNFSAYYSTDGSTWIQVGSDVTITSANTTQDLGVFESANSSTVRNRTKFQDFCIETVTNYSITATAGANGTITSDGITVAAGASSEFVVAPGYDKSFTIDPDAGYVIANIFVDGTDITSSIVGNSYTFEGVADNHTISATFAASSYDITASAGEGGGIDPSGVVAVEYNDSSTFTITPDTAYQISQVLVDGLDITSSLDTSGDLYTFSSVNACHSIAVTFCAATYTIDVISSGSGGSISPGSDVVLDYGESKTFTVTPSSGYYANITVDGTTVVNNCTSEYSYTFSNVIADHTIKASFSDTATVTEEIPGCDINVTADYSGGFEVDDFQLDNLNIVDGMIVLETGAAAIDPNSIVIPFDQEVAVTFIYEGAGYVSDFGYILLSDAVDANGNFLGWGNITNSKKHMIYHNIHDENVDGVLDSNYGNGSFPITSETAIAAYNDNITGYPSIPFVPDNDGSVTNKDMRKVLGTFEAGTELVFFLTADKDWNTDDTTGVFFSKKAWNPDTYTACTPDTGDSYTDCDGTTSTNFNKSNNSFRKIYDLGVAMSEGTCSMEKGWLDEVAIKNLSDWYGIELEETDTYNQCLSYGTNYEHVIVGAPADDPNQWILGWEDLTGAGDADYNDMVFKIERKTGGLATLEPIDSLSLASGSFYTAATIEVYDYMPGGACSGETLITYWVSVDNGENWLEITEWDEVHESDASMGIGDLVTGWTPGSGSPAYTYRTYRIDFAGLGMSGDTLRWKSQLLSGDEDCQPTILNVAVSGTVATNGSFSRSSPVVQANMLYSGSYETPAINWEDKTILRGHLKATRIYDPADPSVTDALEIWDAGAVLATRDISTNPRNIYFPDINIVDITNEVLATADGSTATFTGELLHCPVLAESVSITDTIETFVDIHTDELDGSNGGTGTINRYTGEYTLTFKDPPSAGVPVRASYSYYATSSLDLFNTSNVTSDMLGLDDTYVVGEGFEYDLNGDGKFNNVSYGGSETPDDSDGDWLVNWVIGYKDGASAKKEWILCPVDHSTPAIQSPPGMPSWYYGTDISEEERQSYNAFRETLATRQTIAYVGARDGMIHAFDAGKLRWGDNEETTGIKENRGYFEWEIPGDSSSADYGDGSELWAFIPANLMPRLKNNLLQAEDQAYVDASPTLADVYINDEWKTVLVCAEGNGGDTVFALDVTDPYNPAFLWEFADPDLFRSRSSPTVGLGRIVLGGHAQWVAIFVSGQSSDPDADPSIYIVNVKDGSLIERVYLDAAGSSGEGGVPSGQPAIADSDGNGYIDRLYIGTDKGYMYKVNLPDDPTSGYSSITNCVINEDNTAEQGGIVASEQMFHPIYASPAITIDNTMTPTGDIDYNIKVFFGTGDSPYYDENINYAESGTVYHFFVYVDNEAKGVCGVSPYLDWFLELEAGERIWASAYSAAGQIYFGTSTAETEDPCEATIEGANEGNLYVYTTSGEEVTSFETGNIVTTPIVEDQHLYFRTADGLTSIGGDQYNTDPKITGTGKSEIISWEEISE